jgi:hypothetical protein
LSAGVIAGLVAGDTSSESVFGVIRDASREAWSLLARWYWLIPAPTAIALWIHRRYGEE